MFCKVMQNMNICKKVLELVLEEDLSIKKSHHNKQWKTIQKPTMNW